MNIRKLFALVAVIVLLAAIRCGGESKQTGAESNRLVIALQSTPTSLDPRVGNENAAGRIADLCCSGLIRVTPELDYAPDLAQSWETPDDKTIVFHLHPDAKFQDGRPVTADDVKWTYDSLMAKDFISPKKSGYDSVASIEAPDPTTVIFHLKTANGGLFDNLSLGILPRGSDAEQMAKRPLSDGPYRVVDFKTDESIELEAFEGWHGGAPKIKHITVRIIPDDTTRVLELRRGTIDLETNAIPFENVSEFENSPTYKVVEKAGSVWQYVAFNLRDPILSKVQVRRAIAHAIDRQRIVQDLLRGHGVVDDSMFPPGHWARAENLPTYPFDPNRAKQLLDEAGYPDPDGDGPEARFTLVFKTSTNQEANLRAQAIQQMLRQVGIDMKIESAELGTFLEDIGKGNFQMYSLSRNGIQDPDFYSVIFHSSNFPPAGQNRGYYSNPRVDRLTEQGRATFDRTKRKKIYADIQRIVQEDLPYISLYHQINVAVMNADLDGYVMYPAGFWLSVPHMWWKR
jgi:peptide/nickel transport system substrate-binding protein